MVEAEAYEVAHSFKIKEGKESNFPIDQREMENSSAQSGLSTVARSDHAFPRSVHYILYGSRGRSCPIPLLTFCGSLSLWTRTMPLQTRTMTTRDKQLEWAVGTVTDSRPAWNGCGWDSCTIPQAVGDANHPQGSPPVLSLTSTTPAAAEPWPHWRLSSV